VKGLYFFFITAHQKYLSSEIREYTFDNPNKRVGSHQNSQGPITTSQSLVES
jgi:hypothetical protein